MSNQGVSAWSFGLVDDQLQGCTVGNTSNPRCVYPDAFAHTFNASLTYACPTLLSLPHYYKANPPLSLMPVSTLSAVHADIPSLGDLAAACSAGAKRTYVSPFSHWYSTFAMIHPQDL